MLADAIFAATRRYPTQIICSEDIIDVEIDGRIYRAYPEPEVIAEEGWYFTLQGDRTGVSLISFFIA